MSESPPTDLTLERLDDQINWYDHKSARQKRYFNILKIVTIVAAALIPLSAALAPLKSWTQSMAAVLGAVIVIIEGIQQLYQLQTNWLLYRSTCESLKHEKYLFLANAGPYSAAENPHTLLAERIESLVSQEHAKWASTQQASQQASQPQSPPKPNDNGEGKT